MDKMDEAECRLMAEFFMLFSNPTRLRIFCELREGPKAVSDLAEAAGVTLQNVSQHLRLMREKGAVTTEKDGHHVRYSIMDERFLEGAGMIHDAIFEAIESNKENALAEKS